MIRKATMQDLPAIVDIYAYARNFMVKTGNANQWGDGYPQEKLLRDDIAQKQLYMIEQSGAICGVFVFIIGEDPTYAVISIVASIVILGLMLVWMRTFAKKNAGKGRKIIPIDAARS